jgi:flavin reductase (DIM6/NTAB) family NADH-FMN oxidoreductase RutF
VAEIDPPALRPVLRLFATGVAVVTTWDGDTALGTTVNSFAEAAEEVETCGVSWHPGPTGFPILDDAIASPECTIAEIRPAGDHDMYIGRVATARARDEQPLPLLYCAGQYLRIEHAGVLDIEGKAERSSMPCATAPARACRAGRGAVKARGRIEQPRPAALTCPSALAPGPRAPPIGGCAAAPQMTGHNPKVLDTDVTGG